MLGEEKLPTFSVVQTRRNRPMSMRAFLPMVGLASMLSIVALWGLEPFKADFEGLESDFATGERYYDLYLAGRTVGTAFQRVQKGETGWHIEEFSSIQIEGPGRIQAGEIESELHLGEDRETKAFALEIRSANGNHRVAVAGERIPSGDIEIWIRSETDERLASKVDADMDLGFSTWLRLAARGRLLPGTRTKINELDPTSLRVRTAAVQILGEVAALDTSLAGGVLRHSGPLLHVRVEDAAGVRLVGFVEPGGWPVLLSAPQYRFDIVSREHLEVAPAGDVLASALVDAIELSAIPVAESHRALGPEDTLRVRLAGVPPALRGQLVLDGANQWTAGDFVIVNPERFPAAGEAGYRLNGPRPREMEPYLRAEPFIEANHPVIRNLAIALVGDETDPVVASRRILEYVHERLEKEYAPSLPSAIEALRSGSGDCNEHAALAVALLRAAGVPSRVALGVVRQNESWYYHAWPEVWLGGEWVATDPTFGEIPARTHRVRLFYGLEHHRDVAALVGRLDLQDAGGRS